MLCIWFRNKHAIAVGVSVCAAQTGSPDCVWISLRCGFSSADALRSSVMHVSRRDRRGALLQSIELRNWRAVGAWRYLTQHNDGATRLYSRRISIRVPVGAEFFYNVQIRPRHTLPLIECVPGAVSVGKVAGVWS